VSLVDIGVDCPIADEENPHLDFAVAVEVANNRMSPAWPNQTYLYDRLGHL